MDFLKEELKIEDYELLSQKVYKIIKKAIIEEKIKPGTRILEINIAKSMKVSRTPVREALRKLTAEKFLQIIPNMGIFVPELSLRDLIEVLEVRKILEGYASYNAAKKVDLSGLTILENTLKNMEKMYNIGNTVKFSKYNSEFHNKIFDIVGNNKLKEVYLHLIDQTHRARIRSINKPGRLKHTIQEHKNVFEAIKNKISTKAQRLSEIHIENVIKNIKD